MQIVVYEPRRSEINLLGRLWFINHNLCGFFWVECVYKALSIKKIDSTFECLKIRIWVGSGQNFEKMAFRALKLLIKV